MEALALDSNMPDFAVSTTVSPSRQDVHRMFDRISPRYDLLNRLLSLGLDRAWRRRAVAELPVDTSAPVLDLACGTGDVALAAAAANPQRRVIGIDLAERMLALATSKVAAGGLAGRIQFLRGDGHALPLPDESVGAVTIAFGIRNMAQLDVCLGEIRRVLRRGGKAIILEFSLPQNRLLRRLHLLYLRGIVPAVGRVVSGDNFAYAYLNQTIETFPCGEAFCELMTRAGLVAPQARPLNGGIVTLYTGQKS